MDDLNVPEAKFEAALETCEQVEYNYGGAFPDAVLCCGGCAPFSRRLHLAAPPPWSQRLRPRPSGCSRTMQQDSSSPVQESERA